MSQPSLLRLETQLLTPGLVLGQDIKSPHGAILLPEKTVLTEYTLCKIKQWCIDGVLIVTHKCSADLKVEVVEPESSEDISFLEMYTQTVENIASIFTQMVISKKLPLRECGEIVEKILEQASDVHGIVNRLRYVKSGNNYTYNHSLNVGIYATLLGIWLKYDDKVLRQLAMAGLLHDIGKAKIPAKILDKPGKLTAGEFAEVKKHAVYGYRMIQSTVGLSRQVRIAVAQHHEREDGSGYPLGLTAENIHPYAKIISVVDTYDTITSDRVYRSKSSPYKAVDLILEEGYKTLDPAVVSTFVHHMTAQFFNGKVLLNTGLMGTIVHSDPMSPNRPLLKTDQGFIDLRENPKLHIVELL